MPTQRWWKNATLKDKFILGKQLGIIKCSLEDFKKISSSPKRKTKTR